MAKTPIFESLSTKRRRIAELAKQSPQRAFLSLNHYIDLDWLEAAFYRTRKNGAPGVDGQTWIEYAQDMESNLQSLLDRAKSGTYRAPPVRRVHIPKGTGSETRPIGIPTLEDKVLQRAVVMVLEAIYEQDFYDGSYGFRPGRSAHQALDSLWTQTMRVGGGWILEVDIRKFFDTLDHRHLREFLRRRVCDGVLLRLIGKWLKAGVLEDGKLSYPDDVVIGFTHEEDAQRVMEVLPKRFGKYNLTLHPTKTKLVSFRRPPRRDTSQDESRSERPGTFDLLGFTHYRSLSRKGKWVVKRRTAASRFTRAVRSVAQWCRINRHRPIVEQHQILSQKLRGHHAYFGITGNSIALSRFREEVRRVWRKWLIRRKRGNRHSWSWFIRLLERYHLPNAVAIHSVCRPQSKRVI